MNNWDLSPLYSGFDSPEFTADFGAYTGSIEAIEDFGKALGIQDNFSVESITHILKKYVVLFSKHSLLGSKMMSFASLTAATNTSDATAQGYSDRLRKLSSRVTATRVGFMNYLKDLEVETFERALVSEQVLMEHSYHLKELKDRAAHLISQEAEVVMSRFKQTGSGAWSTLQDQLTSNLTVSVPGETADDPALELPLQSARNLAFKGDPNLRKRGYYAELKAYEKIAPASAAALNAIKGEVLTETELRGFDSVLARTLFDARLSQETLEAMLSAVKDFLPTIRTYQLRKAKLVNRVHDNGTEKGHEGQGLAFFDIHAPIGSSSRQYTFEDAQKMVLDSFYSYDKDLGDFAKEAFEGHWIDVAPKAGKRGGAFCSGIPAIKQSRILLNFTGSLNNVITTAHELGHGFHGRQIYKASILNGAYGMPVAETASIFCETIFKQYIMANAEPEELVGMLETSIQGYAQTIMDIYSRYIFETELFEKRKHQALSVEDLNELMLRAQEAAYGEGLHPEFRHPFMWINKVHYYYAERNFYNFPYTFGLLFAKGLYALYLEQGESFKPRYVELLHKTGQMSIEEIGHLVDIDLTNRKFWDGALGVVKSEIDQFMRLTEGYN